MAVDALRLKLRIPTAPTDAARAARVQALTHIVGAHVVDGNFIGIHRAADFYMRPAVFRAARRHLSALLTSSIFMPPLVVAFSYFVDGSVIRLCEVFVYVDLRAVFFRALFVGIRFVRRIKLLAHVGYHDIGSTRRAQAGRNHADALIDVAIFDALQVNFVCRKRAAVDIGIDGRIKGIYRDARADADVPANRKDIGGRDEVFGCVGFK